MATSQAKTERKTVTLSLRTIAYLEQLAGLGTHGDCLTDVAKSLIEQGIRDAIDKGYLELKHNSDGEKIR